MVAHRVVARSRGMLAGSTSVALLVVALAGCVGPDDAPGRRPPPTGEGGIAFKDFLRTSQECPVRTDDHTYQRSGEILPLVAEVEIREGVQGNERWNARMSVEWNRWPTMGGLLTEPKGASPGDGFDKREWDSVPGRADRITDELRVSWGHEDFEVDGEYKATVSLELTKKRLSPDGSWKTICHRTGDAEVTVHWDG